MLFTPRAASYWALRMAFLIVSAAFIYDCCISFEVAIFCHLCNFQLQRYCFFARYARGRVNFYSICECVLLYILHITAADAFPRAVVKEEDIVAINAGDLVAVLVHGVPIRALLDAEKAVSEHCRILV